MDSIDSGEHPQPAQSELHPAEPAFQAPAAHPPPGAEPQWPPIQPPPEPLLLAQNVYKYYREFPAVQDFSFALAPGETVGLVGPNGAGKTTILRCAAGILRPTAGNIYCGGHDIVTSPALAKPQVALVPETPNLYELLTVTEHLRFIHMAYGETGDFQPRADALLHQLDLTEKAHSLVTTLSKGMRQKVAVACALIHSARILLFDEPFIGIDPAGQRAVRLMIEGAAQQGCCVLISSHILETVENLCSRVLILNRGTLIAHGNLEQLRERAQMGTDTSLEDVFLSLTRESVD